MPRCAVQATGAGRAQHTGSLYGRAPTRRQGQVQCSDRDPLKELRRIFAVFCRPTGPGDDSAAPGEISKARLHRSCKEFDLRLTDDELELMLDSIDANSNQTVDEQEFLAVMSYSAWF